ncbi:MAG: tripartite tricarboxylate transporter TctB family protein [Peptococcaceae bacterium]|jgi:putative tricarboxylic transport membrane protein|nr:tripartite tricarboxylate transporter TctB family protein [Peptococcaceae bacterium]
MSNVSGALGKIKAKLSKNIIGALCIIAVTTAYLTQALKLSFGSALAPGPAFMPVIVSVFILVLGAYNIAKELLFPPKEAVDEISLWEEDEVSPGGETSAARVLALMAALLAYSFVMDKVGFILSTTLITYFLLRLMKFKSWWISLIATVIIVGLTYFVFERLLRIRFPTGMWN